MKVVKIKGGLGNQMFQYAFGKALEAEKNKVFFDLDWFKKNHKETTPRNFDLSHFNVNIAKAQFWHKLFCRNIKEKQANIYEPKLKEQKGNLIFSGYFQTEDYFKNIRSKLLTDFSLKESLNEKNQDILLQIKQKNSVSLHVRRGDYVKLAHIYGVCDEKYYNQAVQYIQNQITEPHFFLFSDDVEWVRNNIVLNSPYTIVDINNGEQGFFDLELMKNCSHNIIANSSFSWWGAWLNQNPNKIVVSPEKWFADGRPSDIICKDWVKISV